MLPFFCAFYFWSKHVTLCLHLHTLFCLCTHPLHLKRPRSASGVLLNGRLWEVVVLPRGRPRSTPVRVAYATAITIESKENVSGWCLKGLSGLCFPCRRMMMIARCIHFEKYLTSVICCTGLVWMLHKFVPIYIKHWLFLLFIQNNWTFLSFMSCLLWQHGYLLKPSALWSICEVCFCSGHRFWKAFLVFTCLQLYCRCCMPPLGIPIREKLPVAEFLSL